MARRFENGLGDTRWQPEHAGRVQTQSGWVSIDQLQSGNFRHSPKLYKSRELALDVERRLRLDIERRELEIFHLVEEET